MTHLTDMEELLAAIPSSDIRDYMREAMNCYNSGAYRGAIVLSSLALFEDLYRKLAELALLNSSAKTLYDEVTSRRKQQDVYENYLLDQLKSLTLLAGLDAKFIAIIQTLRNQSAHPSGHAPTAEEARFVFAETVIRVLSKPILSTTHAVDEIIQRLTNANFFPGKDLATFKLVVADEISGLHPSAMPQLVARLVKAHSGSDPTVLANAHKFLLGLSQQGQLGIAAAIRLHLIAKKSDDPAYAKLIVSAISADGALVEDLKPSCLERLRAILDKRIEEVLPLDAETKLVHPTRCLSSIAAFKTGSELLALFEAQLARLFAKRAHSEFVVQIVALRPELVPLYFPAALARAGSSEFTVANPFSDALEQLDPTLGKLLDGRQSFQLLVAIMRAAAVNAWSAKDAVGKKFNTAPLLRSKALAFVAAEPEEAGQYIETKLVFDGSLDEFVDIYFDSNLSAAA